MPMNRRIMSLYTHSNTNNNKNKFKYKNSKTRNSVLFNSLKILTKTPISFHFKMKHNFKCFCNNGKGTFKVNFISPL